MSSNQTPPWNDLCEPVRVLAGATLITDMKWIMRCRTNQELERKIDGPRLKKTPGGAYKCTDRYSKYERGDDLPGYDTIARGKEATKCPELFRVIEQLKLWWMLEPTGTGYFMVSTALKSLSDDVKQIIFTNRSYSNGELRRRRRDDRSMYEELIRINSVDALTALAALGLEFHFSQTISQFSRSDFRFLKKIVRGVQEMFVRLMVFTPFFEAQQRILEYLGSWQRRHLGIYPYCLFEVKEKDVKQFTIDARELLRVLGEVRLIGPTFPEQMNLVRSYHARSRKEGPLDEAKRIDYECRHGRTVRLTPSSPLYALLKNIGHRAVRSGQAIILPRKLKPGPEFELANALGQVIIPRTGKSELEMPNEEKHDHDRRLDIGDRFKRSGATREMIKSDQRLQMRKPERMITETGED